MKLEETIAKLRERVNALRNAFCSGQEHSAFRLEGREFIKLPQDEQIKRINHIWSISNDMLDLLDSKRDK